MVRLRTFAYTPPPVIRRFMLSNKFGRLIAGPVGSGKTYGCIAEIMRRASAQTPGVDGRRHTRFAIVRQTLTQLKATVLKDLRNRLQGIEDVRVSESTVYIHYADLDCEILLIPLEDAKDQARLLSSQLTAVWISECIEIDYDLIGPIAGRVGRYPNAELGAPTWKGIIADTNFPLEGSPWWELMESPPTTWDIFKQPGGLDEEAENLQWLNQDEESLKLPEDDPRRIALGRAYYANLCLGTTQEYQDRYVHAKYGTDPSGLAVFRTSFKRSYHVSDEDFDVLPGRMLMIGQDFGRNPWSLICQLDPLGRLLVHEEVKGENIGLDQHLRQNLRPTLTQARYLGRPVGVIGDPAGRAKSSLFEINEFDVLQANGFVGHPAPTNDLDPRLRSVETMLLGNVRGEPQVLINGKRCPTLVQALNGGYRFTKDKTGDGRAKPDKGPFSHVADTLQYVCLVAVSHGSYGMMQGRVLGRGRQKRADLPAAAWT